MRRYPGGSVRPAFNREGEAIGSRIQTDQGVFILPHFPNRIKDVRSQLGGIIVVETRTGERRFLGPSDSLEEGGSLFLEDTTGSSMGGHSRLAHGKIRYIVRAFGKWAQGKQHICKERLLREHPDVVGGSVSRANALCSWLKDQWTATTYWRGPGSNPKIAARDKSLEATANATAYSRFSHSMPSFTNTELDMLVEAFSDEYPVGDLLSELAIDPGDRDPFVALFEYDAARNTAAIREAEGKMRAGKELTESMEVWLAAHGDTAPLVEEELTPAIERIVKRNGPDNARGTMDQRVIEAMQIGRAVEPWDLKPARRTALLEDEEDRTEDRKPEIHFQLPPAPKERRESALVIEGDDSEEREVNAPRPELMRMDMGDLVDRGLTLYAQTSAPVREGRRYLRNCGRTELAHLVEQLESAIARAHSRAAEELEEAEPTGNDLAMDPQWRPSPISAGWDYGTRDKKPPVELDAVTLKVPPNLRRGYFPHDRTHPRMCQGCINFVEGKCRAYGNYAVSAGELCDAYQTTHPLNEAEGYMTREGEDVAHYSRFGKGGRAMALHIHPRRDGNYDESVIRMGMSRLQNRNHPASEVHVGHVRIRYRDGEHHIEPDWAAHGPGEENPELACYATVKHGAKHVATLVNRPPRRHAEGGDDILKVDSGEPGSPANAQWPLMPQIGEATSEQVADEIVELLMA